MEPVTISKIGYGDSASYLTAAGYCRDKTAVPHRAGDELWVFYMTHRDNPEAKWGCDTWVLNQAFPAGEAEEHELSILGIQS